MPDSCPVSKLHRSPSSPHQESVQPASSRSRSVFNRYSKELPRWLTFVESIMTHYAATCRPRQTVEDAAERMVEHECGALPVIEGKRIIESSPTGTFAA